MMHWCSRATRMTCGWQWVLWPSSKRNSGRADSIFQEMLDKPCFKEVSVDPAEAVFCSWHLVLCPCRIQSCSIIDYHWRDNLATCICTPNHSDLPLTPRCTIAYLLCDPSLGSYNLWWAWIERDATFVHIVDLLWPEHDP